MLCKAIEVIAGKVKQPALCKNITDCYEAVVFPFIYPRYRLSEAYVLACSDYVRLVLKKGFISFQGEVIALISYI